MRDQFGNLAGIDGADGIRPMGGRFASIPVSNPSYGYDNSTTTNPFDSHLDDAEELRLRRELRDIAERNAAIPRAAGNGVFVNSPSGELITNKDCSHLRDKFGERSFVDYDEFECRYDTNDREPNFLEQRDGYDVNDDLSESEVSLMMTCNTSQEGECEVSEHVSHHFQLEEEVWRSD